MIPTVGIFPDLLWRDDLLLHLPTAASVSPAVQPPHVITRPLSPTEHFLAPSPSHMQPGQKRCPVGWLPGAVSIPQAEQKPWQGRHLPAAAKVVPSQVWGGEQLWG